MFEKTETATKRIPYNYELIVRMRLEGKLDKDISEKLNLSTSTFSGRKKQLYKKAKEFFEKK